MYSKKKMTMEQHYKAAEYLKAITGKIFWMNNFPKNSKLARAENRLHDIAWGVKSDLENVMCRENHLLYEEMERKGLDMSCIYYGGDKADRETVLKIQRGIQ